MSAILPAIASCPRCGTVVLDASGSLVHPTSGERERLRKALGHYWFHHSRTRFDGRFHRCPDRDELDLELNRRPYERRFDRRGAVSGEGPHLWRKTWIAAALSLLIQGVIVTSSFAGPANLKGNAGSIAKISLNVGAATEPDPGGLAVHGSPESWQGREISGGRYQLLERVAEGPAGISYRARNRNLDLDALIEVPHEATSDRAKFAERFLRGVRRQASLQHAHLVKVTEVGESGGWPYVVTEYYPGGSLKFRRPTGSDGRPAPASPQGLMAWLSDVADALDYLHQQGYVHRDVRPANIVFDDQGQAHLGGLGMSEAILTAYEGRPAQAQNLANLTWGAPGYMAPEQAEGLPVDGRADQYALAAIVYELLGGRLPFEGHSAMAVLIQQLTRDPLDLHRIRPEIPSELSSAVARGLARDPRVRFPDCRSFAHDVLAAAVDGGHRGFALSGGPLAGPALLSIGRPPKDPASKVRQTLHISWPYASCLLLGVAACTLFLRRQRTVDDSTAEEDVTAAPSGLASALKVYSLIEFEGNEERSPAPLLMISPPALSTVELVLKRPSDVQRPAVAARRFLKRVLVWKRVPRRRPNALMERPTRRVECLPHDSVIGRQPVSRRTVAMRTETSARSSRYLDLVRHRAG